MPLLLTILSVLAVWAFLTVLVLGLLLIYKPLVSVRAFLEKITMGVRAIEHQVAPLGVHADTLAARLPDTAAALGAAADALRAVERDLDRAPGFRGR